MTRQNAIQTQQQNPTTNPLSRGGILQRKCESCGEHAIAGGECAGCAKKKIGLQRKLTIGASNDPLEREADRIADQVMAAPAHPAVSDAPLRIQRFTGQTAGQADIAAPASVDHVLSSPGRPLDPVLQQDMGQRFGHDFSRVRVHTDAAGERSAREVNANAYTVGRNIVFGAGRYAPGTHEGRRLIAHELTHTIQQNAARNLGTDTKREQISTVGGRLVQRDATLDDLYNNALQAARQTGNFQDAGEKLNGFNHDDIQSRLAQLTQDEVRYMHLGALDNPRVGPDSQVAQLTAPGAPRASTVPPASTQTPPVPAVTPASPPARTPTRPASTKDQARASAQDGLSTGAVIGIVVGVALVAGAIALLATPGGQALGLAIILSISEIGGGGAALATAEAGTSIVVEGLATTAGEGLLGGATATAGEGLLGGATATAGEGLLGGATATAVAPTTVVIQSAATETAIASSSSALAAKVTVGAAAAAAATTLSSDSPQTSKDQDDEKKKRPQTDACQQMLNLRPGVKFGDRWHRQRDPIAGQRTVSAAAFRLDPGSALQPGEDTNDHSRDWVKRIGGIPGVHDAGHVIGKRFGGTNKFNDPDGNIFPQEQEINRGFFVKQDDVVADLHQKGCTVCVKIDLLYKYPSDIIPDFVLYAILYRSVGAKKFNPSLTVFFPNILPYKK